LIRRGDAPELRFGGIRVDVQPEAFGELATKVNPADAVAASPGENTPPPKVWVAA